VKLFDLELIADSQQEQKYQNGAPDALRGCMRAFVAGTAVSEAEVGKS
jgi:hypothetical protein